MLSKPYTIEDICRIVAGDLTGDHPQATVSRLLIDSRKVVFPEDAIFFAIPGERHDGHRYIEELLDKGVRNFVIEKAGSIRQDANFIMVPDVVTALQQLAAAHRRQFDIPVIGITGSNGKTVVKDWLYQLLSPDQEVVRSPKSYNSQVGVPLSVWQLEGHHELALFEAGISKSGEMKNLQAIILPTIGIFTNIGQAHDEGFDNLKAKIREKLLLFGSVGQLVFCEDHQPLAEEVRQFAQSKIQLFSWGKGSGASLQLKAIRKKGGATILEAVYRETELSISIPYTDDASIENAMHCWAMMLLLGYNQAVIRQRLRSLQPLAMRLELKSGINNCSLINDSYSADLASLKIALDFLAQQQQHPQRTVILSDIVESGRKSSELYEEVGRMIREHRINRFIGIGENIRNHQSCFHQPDPGAVSFFSNTSDFLETFDPAQFRDETILVKGARKFRFEHISKALESKFHQTRLEINLNAIVHNLNVYRQMLDPDTRIMVMVKAFSYGSGSHEIASVLQFNRVDYLAVAYADEGVALRNAGIGLPIMVMNPEAESFPAMVKHRLEPEIYNLSILEQYMAYLEAHYSGETSPIHIKIDTGMHRLGFAANQVDELLGLISPESGLKIMSVFSHLAGSDDPAHDDFTEQQILQFREISDKICRSADYPILRHILNSAGISRFGAHQMEMVRLGIGLYGIDASGELDLIPAGTLKTTIAQIREIPADESIGYNRSDYTRRDSRIAIVRIGYADGINRKLGNGKGKMLVNGKRVPTIGDICMDMCMLDITGISGISEGDDVIVFGDSLPVTEVAGWLDTIPYEILTNVSQRVKRIYYEE